MKRLIVFVLCLALIIPCGILASAETTPTITLSNPVALPGQQVTVDVSISNNPGIMAMSFCVTYDSNVLEYVSYAKGYISKDTNVKDHVDKGHIAFVNVANSDMSNNGVMFSLTFNIKADATLGKYTVTLANQNRQKYGSKLHNSFSNSNMKYVVPNVIAGSVTVDGKCEDVGHRYGDWVVITPAGCNSLGQKERICSKCGNPEKDDIPFAHDFEADWTTDKPATPTEDGIMSRHCKNCDAVTDEKTFTYEDTIPDDTSSNQSSTSSNQSSISSNQSSTSSNQSSTSSNQSSTSSNQNNSSNNQSSSSNNQNGTSSNQNSTSNNQNNSSTNQGTTTSTNTTTSSEDSTTNSSSSDEFNKTHINNTLGSKNPLSAVENLKGHKEENAKPDTDGSKPNANNNKPSANNSKPSASDDKQETNTSGVVSKDDEVSSNSSDNTTSQTTKDEKAALSTVEVIALITGAVLSLLIIAGAIFLILKRKKKQ